MAVTKPQQELVLRAAEEEPEVVDGVVVTEGLEWLEWDNPDQDTRNFKVRVDKEWYHHATSEQIKLLQAAIDVIKGLTK